MRKNRSIFKTLTIAVLSVCCGVCVACGLMQDEEKEVDLSSFEMQEATLDFEKENVLAFAFTLDKTEYDGLQSNTEIKDLSFGLLIAPSNYEQKYKPLREAFDEGDGKTQYLLVDNSQTLNAGTEECAEIYHIWSNDLSEKEIDGAQKMYFVGETATLAQEDIATEFTAVGYIKIEESSGGVEYIFTESDDVSSLSYAASKMLNGDTSFDDLQTAKLLDYVESAFYEDAPRYMLLDDGERPLWKSKLDLKIEKQGESVELIRGELYPLFVGQTSFCIECGDAFQKNFTITVINLDKQLEKGTEYFLPNIENVRAVDFYEKGSDTPLEVFDGAATFENAGDYEFVITDTDNVKTSFPIQIFENVERAVSLYNPSGTVEQVSSYQGKNDITKIVCEKGTSLVSLGFDSDNWAEISADYDYVKFNVLYEFNTQNLDSNKVGILCGTSQWMDKDITLGEWKEVKICLKDFINKNRLYFTSSVLPSLELVRNNFNRTYYQNAAKFLYSADPLWIYDIAKENIQITMYLNDVCFGVDNEKPTVSFEGDASYQTNKSVNVGDILARDNLDSLTHKIADFGLDDARGGCSIKAYKVNENADEEIAIVDGKFAPTSAGIYKISVVATDAKGNTTEKSYCIKVNNP